MEILCYIYFITPQKKFWGRKKEELQCKRVSAQVPPTESPPPGPTQRPSLPWGTPRALPPPANLAISYSLHPHAPFIPTQAPLLPVSLFKKIQGAPSLVGASPQSGRQEGHRPGGVLLADLVRQIHLLETSDSSSWTQQSWTSSEELLNQQSLSLPLKLVVSMEKSWVSDVLLRNLLLESQKTLFPCNVCFLLP